MVKILAVTSCVNSWGFLMCSEPQLPHLLMGAINVFIWEDSRESYLLIYSTNIYGAPVTWLACLSLLVSQLKDGNVLCLYFHGSGGQTVIKLIKSGDGL